MKPSTKSMIIRRYIGREIWNNSRTEIRLILFRDALEQFKRDNIVKFGSLQNYLNYLVKRLGFNSISEYMEDWAKNQGFLSSYFYSLEWKKKLGFKSDNEYRLFNAKKRGFKSRWELEKSYFINKNLTPQEILDRRAEKTGFKNHYERREFQVQKRGFKNYNEYCKWLKTKND